MRVRPFIILGAVQLDELKQSLIADISQWSTQWFAAPVVTELDAIQLNIAVLASADSNSDIHLPAIKLADTDQEQWLVCGCDKTTIEQMGCYLLSAEDIKSRSCSDSRLVDGMVHEALTDLMYNILQSEPQSLTTKEEDTVGQLLPPTSFAPGNGVLRCEVVLSSLTLLCWLPASALISRLRPAAVANDIERTKLDDPASALSAQKINTHVLLGDAQLTLGALSQLQLGDVIQLEKTLQEPLSLVVDNVAVRFRGYLGQQKDKWAFRVEKLLH